jgi:hypothetical protein
MYRRGTARGTWLVGAGSNTSTARRLDSNLVPIGFTDSGTLVAVAVTPGIPASLVRVSIAGDEQIALPAVPGALPVPAVVVSRSGRQLGYLAHAPNGAVDAYVENADGSNPTALTSFAAGTLQAMSITLTG